MFKDLTNGKLTETLKFAESIGLVNSLQGCLEGINRYCSPETEVYLGMDFAPHSFTFAVVDKATDRCKLNGGIIFHGRHDGFGSGSAPTFSVSLSGEEGWQIHT
jgi:hypothetical protein